MNVSINSTTGIGFTPTKSGLATAFFGDSLIRQLPAIGFQTGSFTNEIETFFRDLQTAGSLTDQGLSLDWASYLLTPGASATKFPITDFFFVVTGLSPTSPFSLIPMSVSRIAGGITVWGFDPGLVTCVPFEVIAPTNWEMRTINPFATAYAGRNYPGNLGPVAEDSFLSLNGDLTTRPLVSQRFPKENVGPGSSWSYTINRPFADQTFPLYYIGSGMNPVLDNNTPTGMGFSDYSAIQWRNYELEIVLDNFAENQGVQLYMVVPRGRVDAATGTPVDGLLYGTTNIYGASNGPDASLAPNNIEILRIVTDSVPAAGVIGRFPSIQPWAPVDGGDLNTNEFIRLTTSAAPLVNTAFPS